MSISSTLNVQIFRTNVVWAAFSSCMYVVKAVKATFVRKICKNVKMLMKLTPGQTFLFRAGVAIAQLLFLFVMGGVCLKSLTLV